MPIWVGCHTITRLSLLHKVGIPRVCSFELPRHALGGLGGVCQAERLLSFRLVRRDVAAPVGFDDDVNRDIVM